MVRCTVCYWRGTVAGAIAAPRVRQSDIPPSAAVIQNMYEEKLQAARQFGHPERPSCPVCGHHTVAVERRSIRPSA
jgi:hypothetical protein